MAQLELRLKERENKLANIQVAFKREAQYINQNVSSLSYTTLARKLSQLQALQKEMFGE